MMILVVSLVDLSSVISVGFASIVRLELDLLDFNPAFFSDAARLHDHVIINRLRVAHPSFDLFNGRPSASANFSSLPSKPASRKRFNSARPSASLVP